MKMIWKLLLLQENKMNKLIKNKKGIAALIVVLIITASALIMAYNASWLGLGEIDLSYSSQKGGEALSLSEACVEEALLRMKNDSNFGLGEGNITLSIGTNSCIINISSNLNERVILATGIVEQFSKKVEASVNITSPNNELSLNYWREISD